MKIGVDIVDVARIKKLIKNKRFLERVFTAEEVRYSMPKVNRAQHFAVRFASKEAVWKALTDKKVSHKDIGIKNMPDGKPKVFIKKIERRDIEISLSHTDNYAVAVVIIK